MTNFKDHPPLCLFLLLLEEKQLTSNVKQNVTVKMGFGVQHFSAEDRTEQGLHWIKVLSLFDRVGKILRSVFVTQIQNTTFIAQRVLLGWLLDYSGVLQVNRWN